MKTKVTVFLVSCLLAAGSYPLCATGTHRGGASRTAKSSVSAPRSPRASAIAARARLPLSFEENTGQTDAAVKYLARGDGYTAFLTSNEVVLRLQRTNQSTQEVAAAVVRIGLAGSEGSAEIVPGEKQSAKSNYLIGNDPSKWQTNLAQYGEIKYRSVYPGIDLVYHGNQRQIEQDFLVAPGADPRTINIHIAGAERLFLNRSGDLIIATRNGTMRLRRPTAYQETHGNRQTVATNFELRNSRSVGIHVGGYDRSAALVVDPVLDYATYLGGSGSSDSADSASAIAVDSAGNAYITGTAVSTNFPTTAGVLSTTLQNPSGNAFVTKMNATGTGLVFSTYLGGSGGHGGNDYAYDWGTGIAVDSNGNVYVAGYTASSNFPVTATCFQSAPTGTAGAAFLSKLNPTGTSLLYSTYLGGNGWELPGGLAIDANGDMYVAGVTFSTNFPVTASAIQTTDKTNGKGTIFVARINPALSGTASLVFSTYLGGSSPDEAWGIAADANGNAYITGEVSSADFPVKNAFQSTPKGTSFGAFLARIDTNPSTASLVYSTHFSGSTFANTDQEVVDVGRAVDVDSNFNAFISGYAETPDFPTTTGAFQTSPYNGKGSSYTPSAFVARFDTTKTGAASLVYSTLLGGSSEDEAYGLKVDTQDDAFVTGVTSSPDFPVTPIPAQSGQGLAFVSEFNPEGTGLLFSTYFGGANSGPHPAAIALDTSSPANVYITGFVTLYGMQATTGAFQTSTTIGSAFVVKMSPPQEVVVSPASLSFGTIIEGSSSAAYSVTLTNATQSTLSGITISFVGTNPSDFGDTTTCGATLTAGGSCTISVTFTPSTANAESATMQIADSFSSSPQEVGVSGTGQSLVSVNPSSLAFGAEQVSTTSTAKTVTLLNGGATALTINSMSFTGAGASEFAEKDTCSPSVAGGKSCTISITFAPTKIGSQTATLQISDSAGAQTISVSGSGSSAVTANPGTLSFGNVMQNTTSPPKTVTVTNGGTSSLTISGISFTGTNSADFAQTNTCGAALAASSSCTISVTFTPSTEGAEGAKLQISDSDPASPQLISVSGAGASPVSVTPTSIAFGNQTENTTSSAQTVTLSNGGTSSLTITKISIAGANSADFAETNSCGAALAGGSNCTISVTFTPATTAYELATLQVNDSDATSPQSITLSGTGQAPPPADFSVAMNPAQGSVNAGSTAAFSVTVTSLNGFSGAVSFSCSGLPTDSTCSFSPSSVTPSANGTATEKVTISTTKRGFIPVRGRPHLQDPPMWLFGFASLAVLLVLVGRLAPKNPRKLAWTFGAALLLLALGGCSGLEDAHHSSGSGSTGTPAGSYTVTVTGSSGTLSHSASFALTVN